MRALSQPLDQITHPFLRGLPPAVIGALAENAMETEFSEGQVIFREGDPANRFYLLASGRVALETAAGEGDRFLIQTIGPGEALGWSWLFPPYYWHFDARALEAGRAIFFFGTRLREQCEADHDLGYALMTRAAQVLMRRLQATRRRLCQGPVAALPAPRRRAAAAGEG